MTTVKELVEYLNKLNPDSTDALVFRARGYSGWAEYFTLSDLSVSFTDNKLIIDITNTPVK